VSALLRGACNDTVAQHAHSCDLDFEQVDRLEPDGGVRFMPIPEGVTIAMMPPGRSVVKLEM
jgi:hypothetical protein